MGTSNPTNSSIWIINEQLLVLYKLTLLNCYFKLLTLIVNMCNCHVTGIVFWFLFPFNSMRALHKIIQKYSLSVSMWSHNWIRFETRLTTKNRTAETICHLLSRHRHSCNRRVQHSSFMEPYCFCGTEFIVDHKTQTNVRFESLTIVLTM